MVDKFFHKHYTIYKSIRYINGIIYIMVDKLFIYMYTIYKGII